MFHFTFYVCKKCSHIDNESDMGKHTRECKKPIVDKKIITDLENRLKKEFKDSYISIDHFEKFDTFWKFVDEWKKNKDLEKNKMLFIKSYLYGKGYEKFNKYRNLFPQTEGDLKQYNSVYNPFRFDKGLTKFIEKQL